MENQSLQVGVEEVEELHVYRRVQVLGGLVWQEDMGEVCPADGEGRGVGWRDDIMDE